MARFVAFLGRVLVALVGHWDPPRWVRWCGRHGQRGGDWAWAHKVKAGLLLLALAGASTLTCDRREETNPAAPPGPRYYIIGKNGVQTRDARKLLPGFGLVIVDQHLSGGEWIGRTSLGREVAMKDLRPAKPSRFAGVHIDDAGLAFGWVVQEGAPVYPQPDPTTRPIARRARYARLSLASPDGPQGFYRVTDGWMAETDLRVPHRSPRPPAVADDEPWLDVELATQTLVAYLGDKPVFATLVATGVGADGTPFATPKGIHRVRAKLLAATMDNLEHTGVVPIPTRRSPSPSTSAASSCTAPSGTTSSVFRGATAAST